MLKGQKITFTIAHVILYAAIWLCNFELALETQSLYHKKPVFNIDNFRALKPSSLHNHFCQNVHVAHCRSPFSTS